jgi:cell division septal protein FtsQ
MRYARYRSDKVVRVLDAPSGPADRAHRSADGTGTGRTARAGGAVRGTTVREYRQQQRNMARRKRRLPGRAFAAFAVLAILAVAAFLVYQSPLFAVKEVRLEGAQRLGSERLTELAAVPEGSTLLRLDTEGIRERLGSDPWIASVEVRRSFPSTVVLTVTERQMAAVIKPSSQQGGASAQDWLLSKDGIWLGSFSAGTPSEDAAAQGQGGEEGEGTGGAGSEGAEGSGEGAGEGVGGGEGADGGTVGEGVGSGAEGEGGEGTGSDGEGAGGGSSTDGAGVALGTDGAGVSADGPENGASLLADVQVTASEVAALPVVREASPGIAFQVGQAATDEGVLNALAIVNGFSPDMLSLVRFVSAPDRIKTMVTLTNNVEVAFGAAEDVEAKEQVIKALLAAHEGKLTYINVRVADRATYRATG